MPISSRNFFTLKLGRALTRALAIRPGLSPYPADGAQKIASHLVSLCRPSRESERLVGRSLKSGIALPTFPRRVRWTDESGG